MAVSGGFTVPISMELMLDYEGMQESMDRFWSRAGEAISRRLDGLCAERHANDDFCVFTNGHPGTHVTAEGRWIADRPILVARFCDCCGHELED